MNALADAAFLSRPEMPSQEVHGASYGVPYSDTEYQAMGLSMSGMTAAGLLAGATGGVAAMRSLVNTVPALPGPGRHLQILDHTVHRIDAHTKANGEEEKEMVVSNLRHFTLKIGVLDARVGRRDAELPLKAELLYENGQLVEQLATCEPLLVGKTEVVAMQGIALFKLRITSLSSHRDKQRFRIRVSPIDTNLLLHEPGLSVVTTPMKCVTKLSHRSSGGSSSKGIEGEGEGEGEEWDESGACYTGGGGGGGGGGRDTKRKRDDIEPLLEAQGLQLQQLQKTNGDILEQLHQLKQLLSSGRAPEW